MLVAIFLVYPTVTKELFEFFSLETYELWEPESDALGQILQKGRKLRVVKKDLSAVVETIDDIVAGLTVSPSAVRTPVSEDGLDLATAHCGHCCYTLCRRALHCCTAHA